MLQAIVEGIIYDGTGAPPLADGVLLIRNGTIAAIGPKDTVPIPEGAMMISARDCYVLPGLVDAHNHLGLTDPSDPTIDFEREHERQIMMQQSPAEQLLLAVRHARFQLRDGVTTMRIMGEQACIDVEYRKAFAQDIVPGPRVFISCWEIKATHGHGSVAKCVNGVEDMRRVVRETIKAGADWIKLMVTGGGSVAPYTCFLSPDEIQVAVQEAHRAGKRVAAHITGGIGLQYAVEAGVDTVEHGLYLTDEDLDMLRDSNTWLVMTNSWPWDFYPAHWADRVKEPRERVKHLVRRAYDRGLRVAIGTDEFHYDHGLAHEMEILVACGVSEREALWAGTKAGAELCGVADSIGSLEPGKIADVVMVGGNPLVDIRALRDIRLVMKEGKVYQL
jgi:imidazolonepropionase-like amidohydrolase